MSFLPPISVLKRLKQSGVVVRPTFNLQSGIVPLLDMEHRDQSYVHVVLSCPTGHLSSMVTKRLEAAALPAKYDLQSNIGFLEPLPQGCASVGGLFATWNEFQSRRESIPEPNLVSHSPPPLS